MSHFSISNFGFRISDLRLFVSPPPTRESQIQNLKSQIHLLSYRFNLQSRVTLPMSLGALIMLAPLLFEYDDLGGSTVIHNRSRNLGPINQRIAKPRFLIVRRGQRLEVDRSPDFLFQQGNANG